MTNHPILVTGGAGFIGSHFVDLMMSKGFPVVVLDSLTYASQGPKNPVVEKATEFFRGPIGDQKLVAHVLRSHEPRAIFNFAAETHVDRSIASPQIFLESNTLGTFSLLQQAKEYWSSLSGKNRECFRYIQISTDEVFGDLSAEDPLFHEESPYRPNSPYAASKASGDLFVRSWYKTYGFPSIVTYSTNNYGPGQHSEKLIPKVIETALGGASIPVYGTGKNIRDWIFVKDHCLGLAQVLNKGDVGESYGFSGRQEKTNLEVVQTICEILDKKCPRHDGLSYGSQLSFVEDRLGHDRRYGFDPQKVRAHLDFRATTLFEDGIEGTVDSFLRAGGWL